MKGRIGIRGQRRVILTNRTIGRDCNQVFQFDLNRDVVSDSELPANPLVARRYGGCDSCLGAPSDGLARDSRNRGSSPMRTRHSTLLWMKDLIDHMNRCHEQLVWTSDGPTESFLTEAMMGDLSECRRLCEQLRHR